MCNARRERRCVIPDIKDMTKEEQLRAYKASGKGAFRTAANIFQACKVLSYLAFLPVIYLAFQDSLSWWWLAAPLAASALFEHCTNSSVHSHLMRQGYDYRGVTGNQESELSPEAEESKADNSSSSEPGSGKCGRANGRTKIVSKSR